VGEIKVFNNELKLPEISCIFGKELLMANFTAEQFIESMSAYRMGYEGFPLLVAILTEKDFDEKKIINLSSTYQRLPMSVCWSTLAYFNSVLNDISERYKWIFDSSSSDAKTKSAFNKSGLSDFGLNTWYYEIAEGGMFGTVKEIKQMPMWEFIDALSYIRACAKFQKFMYD
jgi:hypothetical protein